MENKELNEKRRIEEYNNWLYRKRRLSRIISLIFAVILIGGCIYLYEIAKSNDLENDRRRKLEVGTTIIRLPYNMPERFSAYNDSGSFVEVVTDAGNYCRFYVKGLMANDINNHLYKIRIDSLDTEAYGQAQVTFLKLLPLDSLYVHPSRTSDSLRAVEWKKIHNYGDSVKTK